MLQVILSDTSYGSCQNNKDIDHQNIQETINTFQSYAFSPIHSRYSENSFIFSCKTTRLEACECVDVSKGVSFEPMFLACVSNIVFVLYCTCPLCVIILYICECVFSFFSLNQFKLSWKMLCLLMKNIRIYKPFPEVTLLLYLCFQLLRYHLNVLE